MRIAEINMVDYGSTGNIMFQIADCAIEHGHIVKTFSKKWRKQNAKREYHSYYGSTLENGLHVVLSRTIGFQGLYSYFGTKALVRELKKFKPDIIHLHNLHDSSTCLPVLFKYISKHNIKTVWTLHDCWAMTGQCPYFTMVKCDKWKVKCHDCPQKEAKLPIDCSSWMWEKKKKWFTSVPNMIIVTPSQWLADLVKQSYLKDYPVRVINNGINLNVFKPVDVNSPKNGGASNYIVLFVAFGWGVRKGLDVIIDLAKRLPKNYHIIIVGSDDHVDKLLPVNVLSIHRTQNLQKLAQLYAIADVFANPTREEVLGMVNIEALACGTPVVTFKSGGSPECVDVTCGIVVETDNNDQMIDAIIRICEQHPFSKSDCIKQAKKFEGLKQYEKYIKLYEELFR